MRNPRRIVIIVVAVHTLFLVCYTFPGPVVPEKLRVIAQLYARPLFHQQWQLFAPDPPLCSCMIEARWGGRPWRSIDHGPDTYLQRRTVQALARHVQAKVHAGDTVPSSELLGAMRSMALYSEFEPGEGRTPPVVAFRLVERCVTDALRPTMREQRITELHTP